MTKLNGRNGAVGYKQPPAHTRFAKGKSGSPNGRPKDRRTEAALASVVNQTVTVTLEGAPRQVPLTEAMAMSLAQKGLAGNIGAAREFMKFAEKVAAQQKEADEKNPQPLGLIQLVGVQPRDCNTALEKLNVIEPAGSHYRIPTWVVVAALARNNQLLIDETDRGIVADNMLVPSVLETILPKVT